jgi:hypothetical protein
MLIVTNLNKHAQEIIDIIKPPKVLHMKYKSDNALISQAKVGIAFEYGEDESADVLNATLYDIAKILEHYQIIDTNPFSTSRVVKTTDIYEVYDAFQKNFSESYVLSTDVRNFELCPAGTTVGVTASGKSITAEESFYPILFGENRYTEILGFKSRKVSRLI